LKDISQFKITIDRESATPVYQQLCGQIKDFIRSDFIQIGESLPPENEICELSSLSRMTVRRAMEALSKQGLVVAERGRGTFVVAKEPLNQIHASIGFALRPHRYIEEDPFYSHILLGVTQEAQRCGFHLAFVKGENLDGADSYSKRYSFLNKLSGLIVAGQMPPAFLDYLRKIRIPCVFLNYCSPDYPCDAVSYDQKEIGKILGRHLVELDHRYCLYLSGEPENIAYEDRLAGFMEIFVGKYRRDIHILKSGKDSQSGRTMIREALERSVPFSVVAAGNDMIAIGAMNELQDLGFHVPKDVSVCGINNIPGAEHCRPTLTTVHIEKQEMGARAVQLLLQRIQNPKRVQETVLLGVKLMPRQSTAKAPRTLKTTKEWERALALHS